MIKNVYKEIQIFFNNFIFCFNLSWKASKILLVIRLFLEIVFAFQTIFLVFLSKEIINTLVLSVKAPSNKDVYVREFIIYILILLALNIVKRLINNSKKIIGGIHKDKIFKHINLQIVNKTSALDLSYFDSPEFYNEIKNTRRDSRSLETINMVVINSVNAVVSLVTAIIVLSKLNMVFPLLLIILSAPYIIVEKYFTKYIFNWQRDKALENRKMDYLTAILTDKGHSKDIRLFNISDIIIDKYKNIWAKWFSEKKSISINRGKWIVLLSILPKIGKIYIMFYVGIEIINQVLTIGDYRLYTGMAGQITSSLFTLINAFITMYDNNIKISKYQEFLNWKSKLSLSGNLKPNDVQKIEFKNIYFKYPGTDKYILKNLNFKIYSNEKIALVGLNGAGKTTIIKLLLRFYDPVKGHILLNGIDIKNYNINEYRKKFSALFQNCVNYAFTIKENITLSNLDKEKDIEQIIEACKKGGMDKIINKYEKGLDTYLTRQFKEDGIVLSGGERQKVALARTFFRDGDIIILDEPSSALDAEADHEMFEYFAELSQNNGAIFISHRLSNVTIADRILVLENGQIIEEGTHKELLRTRGKYSHLFNLQAEKYMAK